MCCKTVRQTSCFSIDPNDLPVVEADTENFVTYKFTYNNCDMLGFNMEDPICGDYNFRMAVASALNREEITLAACGAYGIPETTGTFYGYATEFRNNDIPIIPYDLEKAKEYLAASPYNGETIELTTAISTNITASAVIQQQLSLIGIKIEIKQTDPPSMASFCSYGNNKTQMICYIAPQTLSAQSYRNLYYPSAGYNRVSYNNPEVTALLDKAPTLLDLNERKAVYYQLQELIAKDPPYLNLFWLVNEAACVKGVDGMVLSPDSYFDLRYIYKVVE
jgi:peptide/nickel transport system substrate-binding protein